MFIWFAVIYSCNSDLKIHLFECLQSGNTNFMHIHEGSNSLIIDVMAIKQEAHNINIIKNIIYRMSRRITKGITKIYFS